MRRTLLFSLASMMFLAACTFGKSNAVALHWSWLQTGTGSVGQPINDLMLVEEKSGNTVGGTQCEGVVAATTDIPNALSIRCWWAGGGEDFAVMQSGSMLLVQKRYVDEESGFGPWETLQTLN